MDPTNPEHRANVRELFLEALALPTPAEREAYLDRACQADHRLRAKVDALLRSHRQDQFLEGPAILRKAHEAIRSAPAVAEGHGTQIVRYQLLEPTILALELFQAVCLIRA